MDIDSVASIFVKSNESLFYSYLLLEIFIVVNHVTNIALMSCPSG